MNDSISRTGVCSTVSICPRWPHGGMSTTEASGGEYVRRSVATSTRRQSGIVTPTPTGGGNDVTGLGEMTSHTGCRKEIDDSWFESFPVRGPRLELRVSSKVLWICCEWVNWRKQTSIKKLRLTLSFQKKHSLSSRPFEVHSALLERNA